MTERNRINKIVNANDNLLLSWLDDQENRIRLGQFVPWANLLIEKYATDWWKNYYTSAEYQAAHSGICYTLGSASIRKEFTYHGIARELECSPVTLSNDPEVREYIEHLIKTLPIREITLEEVGGDLSFMDNYDTKS